VKSIKKAQKLQNCRTDSSEASGVGLDMLYTVRITTVQLKWKSRQVFEGDVIHAAAHKVNSLDQSRGQ
jgi:hypothetical protein